MKEKIILEELRKYLKMYALSENNYDKREFALDLLMKLDNYFGAAQLKDTAPSVGPQSPDSLDK